MRIRRMMAAAAAGLGAAALVVVPFASRAPADAPATTLPIYALSGVGNGVELELAPKPEVLDPLVDIALMRAETKANAAGGGSSSGLAADIYPGAVAVGGAGCPNFKYLQMFGIVQSSYPPTSCQYVQESADAAPLMLPPGGNAPAVLDAGHVTTQSSLSHSRATAVMNHLSLAPATGISIVVDQMRVVSDSLTKGSMAIQTVTVSTGGVHVVTPAISLDILNMVSQAVSTSDGTNGTTDTSFTIGDASATFSGVSHRVTIDASGVHLADLNGPTPPAGVTLPADIRQPLSQQMQEALAQSMLIIRAGTPSEIANGASAESSIGGLLISFESGRPPAVPISVPVSQPTPWPTPSPVALPSPLPTLDLAPQGWPVPQFQPICPGAVDLGGHEIVGQTGLCVGQGIVPVPPGDVLASLSLGGVDASAAASNFFPGGCFTCGTTTGTTTGFGTTGASLPGGTTGGFTTGGTTGSSGTTGTFGPRPVYGLVARLPSAALAGAGAGFLILAVGLSAGPSLRR